MRLCGCAGVLRVGVLWIGLWPHCNQIPGRVARAAYSARVASRPQELLLPRQRPLPKAMWRLMGHLPHYVSRWSTLRLEVRATCLAQHALHHGCGRWVMAGEVLVPRGAEGTFDSRAVAASANLITWNDQHWLYYQGWLRCVCAACCVCVCCVRSCCSVCVALLRRAAAGATSLTIRSEPLSPRPVLLASPASGGHCCGRYCYCYRYCYCSSCRCGHYRSSRC